MKEADAIWRLIRDVLITSGGLFLLVLVGLGVIPSEAIPSVTPLIIGCFAAPKWLRDDEKKRRARDEGDGPINDDGAES